MIGHPIRAQVPWFGSRRNLWLYNNKLISYVVSEQNLTFRVSVTLVWIRMHNFKGSYHFQKQEKNSTLHRFRRITAACAGLSCPLHLGCALIGRMCISTTLFTVVMLLPPQQFKEYRFPKALRNRSQYTKRRRSRVVKTASLKGLFPLP